MDVDKTITETWQFWSSAIGTGIAAGPVHEFLITPTNDCDNNYLACENALGLPTWLHYNETVLGWIGAVIFAALSVGLIVVVATVVAWQSR